MTASTSYRTVDEEIEALEHAQRFKRAAFLRYLDSSFLWKSDAALALGKAFTGLFVLSGKPSRAKLVEELSLGYVEDAGSFGIREGLADVFFEILQYAPFVSHDDLMSTPPKLIDTTEETMKTALPKAWSLYVQSLFDAVVGEWIELLDALDDTELMLVAIPSPQVTDGSGASLGRFVAGWQRWEGKSHWVLEVPQVVKDVLVLDCSGILLPAVTETDKESAISTFLDLSGSAPAGSLLGDVVEAFEAAALVIR